MNTAVLDRAKAIVRQIAPNLEPEMACMLIAAAIAGQRGLTMRHIRIGALFWPTKFATDPYLSLRGGWGCEGFSAGRLYLADETVDEDNGGFSGHTWLEPKPRTVVDLMHDNTESARDICDADFKIIARYIPRTKLERAVKSYWRPEMLAAIKLATNMD